MDNLKRVREHLNLILAHTEDDAPLMVTDINDAAQEALKELDSFMEKLQSENKRLREALEFFVERYKNHDGDTILFDDPLGDCLEMAEAALQHKE